jgi:ATP-dependent Clp protease ATP-binding subunit ClpA
MFLRLRQGLRDMRTIAALCSGAEQHANAEGQREPGAEHFVLAALDLPEGSARKTFERVGADPAAFRAAIEQQYAQALAAINVPTGDHAAVPAAQGKGLYRARASGQALLQLLAAWPRENKAEPLSGAHVIGAAAKAAHGVGPRALRAMGIDPDTLLMAARAEIAAMR